MLDTKLTVKPYLNNNIKKADANKTQVYVRVTYNKKNTQMSYKKALFEPNNISLTNEEFNKQVESIKEKASKYVIPIMYFLKKYSKDDVNTLPLVMDRLNNNFFDVIEEIYHRMVRNNLEHDYDNVKNIIDAEGKEFTFIPENPIIGHLRSYLHAFLLKEFH